MEMVKAMKKSNAFVMSAAACAVLLVLANPALAADAATSDGMGEGLRGLGRYMGAGLGGGLAVIGGAAGIGKIGASALESMARQPEVAGTISTNMLIAAALVEGATLFAVVVGLLCLIL
jgi:F-type H+-transporting ATPase subunit c